MFQRPEGKPRRPAERLKRALPGRQLPASVQGQHSESLKNPRGEESLTPGDCLRRHQTFSPASAAAFSSASNRVFSSLSAWVGRFRFCCRRG